MVPGTAPPRLSPAESVASRRQSFPSPSLLPADAVPSPVPVPLMGTGKAGSGAGQEDAAGAESCSLVTFSLIVPWAVGPAAGQFVWLPREK